MGITASKPTSPRAPPPPPPRPLQIIIVGAGIGGLTAAIALKKQGHRVQVFEASSCDDEAGAAINLCPNATKCLRRLEIDAWEHGAVELGSMRLMKVDGTVVEDRDMSGKVVEWGNDWLLTHRAHLYHHLKEILLADHDSITSRGMICFGMRVTSVDPQNGIVRFADGSGAQGDVILGADGVHSKTRLAISDAIHPFRSEKSAFRFLVPREEALDDPRTRKFFERENCMEHWYSSDCKVVVYPCVENEVLNFVCIHPAHLSPTPHNGANPATRGDLLKVFKDFDLILLAMFEKAIPDTLDVYPLQDMDVLPTFVNERLALLGDAAHPLLPYLAQGAAMAIEDATSLGVMLSCGTKPEEVRERLKMYNEARYERAGALQRYSRIVGEDGMGKGGLGRLSVHDYLEYAFDHDEHEASEDILERFLEEREEKTKEKEKENSGKVVLGWSRWFWAF